MTGSAWARWAWPQMIRAGTQLRSVPLVPDIRLHLASDPISLWQRTELTSGRTGLDPPFWAFAWAGGLALARYLLDHPETVRGRHAIDIASGSGVVAIAAAMAGAAAVTAYDIDPVAAAAIRMNAAANGVMVLAVCADVLDQDNLLASGAGPVLVADAFDERDLAAKVTKLAERGRARGAAVLVGDFGRAISATRPAHTAGQLRRSRPAHARRQRHQAHDHLGTPLTTGSNCERRTGRSARTGSHMPIASVGIPNRRSDSLPDR